MFPLTVPNQILEALIVHARSESPRECCGVLAGPKNDKRIVSHHFRLVNSADAPMARFESSPESMFAAVKSMRAMGLEILAVYHSHPTSSATPSVTDRQLNYSPEVANVIISLATERPVVRAWRIDGEHVSPIELILEMASEGK